MIENIDEKYPVTSGQTVIKKRGETYAVKDVRTGIHGEANEDLQELLLLCDGTRTVKEISEEISKGYEESQKEVEKKVKKSIEFLEDLHFLHFADQPGYAPLIIRDTDLEWPLDAAYLEITNKCNLKCTHCYKTAGAPLPEELSTKEWFSIIDELEDLGILTVAVTGGEPFMRADLFDILEYLAAHAISVNLFTNGTLITTECIEALKELNPEKVVVSIDGATRKTHERIRGRNTFDKTVESIANLVKNGLHVRSNTLIYTENIKELELLIKMLLDVGVREMIFDRFMEAGRGVENTELIPPLEVGKVVSDICSTFEKEAPQKIELKYTEDIGEQKTPYSFCGIGTSMMTVKADGDVVLCPVLSDPEFTAGNIKDAPLRELWESTIFQPFRECSLDDMVCHTCPHSTECRGGCKARVFQHYKTFCMPDPWMCAARGQKWPEK